VHIPLELDDNPFAETAEVHDEAVQHVPATKLQAEDAAVEATKGIHRPSVLRT
jgi:hypothetical protein